MVAEETDAAGARDAAEISSEYGVSAATAAAADAAADGTSEAGGEAEEEAAVAEEEENPAIVGWSAGVFRIDGGGDRDLFRLELRMRMSDGGRGGATGEQIGEE